MRLVSLEMSLANPRELPGYRRDSLHGPDLAFMPRSPEIVETLEASSKVFLNVERQAKAIFHERPSLPYFDVVIGVVAEWSRSLPPRRPDSTLSEFSLLFGVGTVRASYTIGGFDLCEFDISFGASDLLPSTYKSVSGGGLWRAYVDPRDRLALPDKLLLGVAFREFESDRGSRIIKCHGPRSIYHHLLSSIEEGRVASD